MNLNNQESQPRLKILDRKTDAHGRAIYKVAMPNQPNLTSWEPIQNLLPFMDLINEFQNSYEQRVEGWINDQDQYLPNYQHSEPASNKKATLQPVQSQSQPNHPFEYGIQQMLEQEANQQLNIPPIEYNIKLIAAEKINEIIENGCENYDLLTTDKEQAFQQQKLNQKMINSEPFQNNHQIRNKQDNQKSQQQIENRQIMELLVRRRQPKQKTEKYSQTKSRFSRRINFQQQEQVVKAIKQIYQIERIWYAKVILQDGGEGQILRDQLRITYPRILLAYYEQSYEGKLKNFSIGI